MASSKDFSKMTLEELTPIVSMRPGKEYTKEELREARAAFMKALEGDAPTVSEDASSVEETVDTPSPENAEMMPEAESIAEFFIPEETEELTPHLSETLIGEKTPTDILSAQTVRLPEITEETNQLEIAEIEETFTEHVSPIASESEASVTYEENDISVQIEEEKEEFILKTHSKLARVLYILYAYLFVPILALEALSLLIASVVTAVSMPDLKHLFLYVFCAAVYTLVVALAWHQFLYRSKFGLLLNRSLIGVCLFRGIAMLFSSAYLSGVVFIALSILYLVFFIGYDSTFIIKSPKK